MLTHRSGSRFATLGLALALIACTPAGAAGQTAADRPAPVPRFHQVDERLFRGGQPGEAGFRYLRDLGVRTVINLREAEEARREDEQRIVEALGMRYVSLPVKNGSLFRPFRRIPSATVERFLELIDSVPGPVFVHCHRGADRTGTLVGIYRISRHGWDGSRALDEAARIGMRFWYVGLKRQIEAFARRFGS
jgi:protein tyrosine/serine phosphatase